jgi:hypothetical protein
MITFVLILEVLVSLCAGIHEEGIYWMAMAMCSGAVCVYITYVQF